MCNCSNRDFIVINNHLNGEYDGDFHEYDEESYSFCPICGENLQSERLNPEDFGKWIKIENNLPSYEEKVLAFSETGQRIYICYRVKEEEYNEHWNICENEDCVCVGCTAPISHWMSLPKFPLEKVSDSPNNGNK